MPEAEAKAGLRQVAAGPAEATETEGRVPPSLARAVPRNATVATDRGGRPIAWPPAPDGGPPAPVAAGVGTPVAVLEVAVLVVHLAASIAAGVVAA